MAGEGCTFKDTLGSISKSKLWEQLRLQHSHVSKGLYSAVPSTDSGFWYYAPEHSLKSEILIPLGDFKTLLAQVTSKTHDCFNVLVL